MAPVARCRSRMASNSEHVPVVDIFMASFQGYRGLVTSSWQTSGAGR
jgi:hypothetical protein